MRTAADHDFAAISRSILQQHRFVPVRQFRKGSDSADLPGHRKVLHCDMFGALQRVSLEKPAKPEREDHFAQFESGHRGR
jgi:hypothetical protein